MLLQLVKRHAAEIFTSVIVSTLFSLYSTALVGRLVELEPTLTVSILPRCITVALALSIVSFFEGIVIFQNPEAGGRQFYIWTFVFNAKLKFDLSIILYSNENSFKFIYQTLHNAVHEDKFSDSIPFLQELIFFFFYILVVGANSSLTAAVVVVTGLLGANFVQAVLDKLQFRDPIARGIATASRYVLC